MNESYHQPSLFDEPKKVCRGCGELKLPSDYGKRSSVKSGLRSRCKQCDSEEHKRHYSRNAESLKQRQRAYYQENKEYYAAYNQQWKQENKEKVADDRRRWYLENHAHALQYSRRYYEENRESIAEYSARRYLENNGRAHGREYQAKKFAEDPQPFRERVRLRRLRKKNADGYHAPQEFKELCLQYDNKCLACGRSDVKLTRDHVVPLTKGGSDDISNIQPLCHPCNSAKGTKTIDYREGA